MKTVKWGILGASNFALRHMGPAIHAAHGAELVAVASSSAEKVAGFQTFAPAARHVKTYEALLAEIFGKKVLGADFSQYLHIPTLTDPSLAPAGHHVPPRCGQQDQVVARPVLLLIFVFVLSFGS